MCISNSAQKKTVRPERTTKYLYSISYGTSRYGISPLPPRFCSVAEKRNLLLLYSVLAPFEFTAKNQAESQIMNDEWVTYTILTARSSERQR